MNDYALPLILLRKLASDYEDAMLKGDKHKAYQLGVDLVEMALKLQDLASDN